MATITYDANDAIYGSGVYGVARYGVFGPTLTIDGVGATSAVGIAEGNPTELLGAEDAPAALISALGTIQVNISENLDSVSATSALGTINTSIIEFLDSVPAASALGTVKPIVTEFVEGLELTSNLNGALTFTTTVDQLLDDLALTGSVGDLGLTAVQFNYEAVATQYSRFRTVRIPRAA